MNRCDICGRFKKWEDLYGMSGDSSDGWDHEVWQECVDCMSKADLERLVPERFYQTPDYRVESNEDSK